MSREYVNIYKFIELCNSGVKKFDGSKTYISTGDSDDLENGEIVTYKNRPSRANVIAKPGDILIAKMSKTEKTILIDNITAANIYSTGFYCLNSRVMHNKYLYYLLSNYEFNMEKDSWSFGTTQISLNENNFKKIKIHIENDLSKQEKIQTLLDKKVDFLNLLISNQQQQIEKLKEYKQSLIREVVTKGLDPNVEFKESGIEWVGLIAKKSKLIQLKRLARINNGKEIRNVDGDIPVYGSGGIFKYTDEYLYEGESILYGRKGTIDKPLHVSGKFWTVDTMFYTEISKLVLPRYLYYISVGSINFDYYKSGSVLPSMTQFELGNVLMPVFDIKSQIEIVKYLDHKTNMIDRLIELKYTKINNIEEYKKSLIYEYVTGKKEVS
jgi:type I restriction enzyme S subunit